MKKLETIETANNSFVRDDLPAEVEIIGISFRGSTKVYYFAANGNVAKDGNNAIVETARGLEYGKVTLANTLVKRETLVLPLKNVVRIADKNDDLRYEANREKEKEAFEICAKLRANGIACEIDHMARGVKAQFKYADKIGAEFVAVIGSNELVEGQVKVKKMADGSEQLVKFEDILDYISKV